MNTTFKYSLEGQETERLLFRKLFASDFVAWMEFCADDDSVKYISLLSNLQDPKERCNAWFERVFNRYEKNLGGMNVLIEKATNQFIGQCGLLLHTVDEIEELEIGYSLLPSQRGKGFAIEAAKKCRDFAFENNFRSSLISIIDINNLKSAQLAINSGMQLEKQTNYNNSLVNIFRINKSDFEKEVKL